MESDDPELEGLIATLQHHSHTFTCYKKKGMVTIGEHNGHGRLDGVKIGPILKVRTCRFMFPRPPVRKTSVVTPPDEDDNENTVQQWREYYQKIRNYLHRTPKSDFCIKGCPRKDNRTEGVRGRIIGYNRTSTWAGSQRASCRGNSV